MAVFFGDSFDLYALPADALNGYWDSGTTGFALAAGRFTGGRSIVHSATGAWLVKSSGSNDAVHHIVCAYQQTAAISGSTLGLYFQLTDASTNQVCIVFRSDGAILLTSATPAGTVLATYTGAVTSTGAWFAFEFEVVINASTGSFAVRKNGSTSNDFSAGSLNTRPGTNAYANKLTVGSNVAVTGASFDDVLWRSDNTPPAWVGDIRCYTRLPNADASATWSRLATFQMQPYASGAATSSTPLTVGTPKYTPFISQGGTIGSVVVNFNLAMTANVKCAIYASTVPAGGGQPGTVVQSATAAITNPTVGANTFTFSPSVSITKGQQFFVALCSDATGGSALVCANTAPYTTAAFLGATAYASFPANNPGGLSATNALAFMPVVTPTANSDAVCEPQQDSAASYVYSSTVGQADLYTLQSISATPATVVGVVTRGFLQKSDAGSRSCTVDLKSGSTTVSTSATGLNTAWTWIYRTDLTDPATGAAWTSVAVNNAQIGATVTL